MKLKNGDPIQVKPILNILKHGKIDYDAFDDRYAIVMIDCNGDWRSYNEMFRIVRPSEKVMSLKRKGYKDYNTQIHVLGDCNIDELKSIINSLAEPYDLNYKNVELGSREIPPELLFQLMVNSLARNCFDRTSNAQGRYLKVVDEETWEKIPGGIKRLIVFELEVERPDGDLAGYGDVCLRPYVHSFNNGARSNINWGKRKRDNVQRFSYDPHKGLDLREYKAPLDDGNTFVEIACIGDTKAIIPLMDWSTKNKTEDDGTEPKLDKYRASLMYDAVERLDMAFGEFMGGISLLQVEGKGIFTATEDEYLDRMVGYFEGKEIFIYNNSGDDQNAILNRFVESVERVCGLKLKVTNGPNLGGHNIELIHNPKYYEEHKELKDPYSDPKYNITQHITVEGLEKMFKSFDSSYARKQTTYNNKLNKWLKDNPGKTKKDYDKKSPEPPKMPYIEAVIEQLFIKDELETGHLRYSWEGQPGTEGDWHFAIPLKRKIERELVPYGFASFTVHKDGSMTEPKEFDLSGEGGVFSRVDWGSAEFAFEDPQGNVNAVIRTNVSTLVNANYVRNTIKDNNRKGVGRTVGMKKDHILENFSGCLDIGRLDIPERGTAFYIGDRHNFKMSFANSSTLYLVTTIQGEENIGSIMWMMAVPFVRHNQNTVKPFPVKYLEEYCRKVDIIKSREKEADSGVQEENE